MRIWLATFVIIMLTFQLFSQHSVEFNISPESNSCINIPKECSIYEVGIDSTKLLTSSIFDSCLIKLNLEYLTGSFILKIRASTYEEVIIPFEININSNNIIELGFRLLKEKSNRLEEVTISGIKRSFIQNDADKTTVIVKDNPILTVSSIYDALLKIPGIVPYPGGGFSIYGKIANIYFEGIPSNLSGDDLTNLLKSLPATSVEKIEIISNPGASYDANVSGAIINIISLSKAGKWLSGTLTMNYGINKNNKVLPSLIVSGRNKRYSWQFQSGYTEYERTDFSKFKKEYTFFSPNEYMISDRTIQSNNNVYYIKPTLNYKLTKKSNLILSYNGMMSKEKDNGLTNIYSEQITPSIFLSNTYQSNIKNYNNEYVIKYKNTFDTLKRTLDITAYYSDYQSGKTTQTTESNLFSNTYNLLNYNIQLKNVYTKADLEIPIKKYDLFVQLGAKYSALFAKSLGRYNLENSSNQIFNNNAFLNSIGFNYTQNNLAGYLEIKKGIKKLALGAGIRVENFNLNQNTSLDTNTIKANYLNFFPSFNAIYRFSPDINLIATYSRKINIPSYNQFDPNNSNYYDKYNSSSGNILLKPNFYDNVEAKITIFDYLELSVNYTHSQTLNMYEYTTNDNSLQSTQTYRTYHNINVLTYFFAIPVPFGVFKDGLGFFNKPIDIDKINFVYLYSERIKTSVGDLITTMPNTAVWNYGMYSQFILPFKIRMNLDYMIGTKGMYQIYNYTRLRNVLEIVFSKDFMKNKLKTSITIQDVFNQSQSNFYTNYKNMNLSFHNKLDTRILWFKIAYTFGQFSKPNSNNSDIENVGKDIQKGVTY